MPSCSGFHRWAHQSTLAAQWRQLLRAAWSSLYHKAISDSWRGLAVDVWQPIWEYLTWLKRLESQASSFQIAHLLDRFCDKSLIPKDNRHKRLFGNHTDRMFTSPAICCSQRSSSEVRFDQFVRWIYLNSSDISDFHRQPYQAHNCLRWLSICALLISLQSSLLSPERSLSFERQW